MFKLDLEKAEEPEIKKPTSFGSQKRKKNSRKTSTSASLYTKAFDCVDHNKLWKILKDMGIPDHLTCFSRNLYAGQEATVRTGHGTTDWFQIGKGFGIVNKAEIDVFLELSCFLDDPTDIGNLISGSSAFSKSSLNIWKFSVHIMLKPSLENSCL